MSDSALLSPKHAALVEAARQRADHRLVPPERVRGGARRRLAQKLVTLGLADLSRAAEAAWGAEPDGGPTGLRLTASRRGDATARIATTEGYGSTRVELDSSPASAAAPFLARRSTAEPIPGDHRAAEVAALRPAEPRSWTKIARVLALLRRPEGADLAALVAATGWLPHTARAALTGLRRKGHAIDARRGDGRTVYRVATEVRPMAETDAGPATASSAAAAR